MRGLIAWFASNNVAANLLMLLVVVGGAVTLPGIKQEIFPELTPERISVTVEYLGAAPDEIEESICARVEEAVQGLTGIRRIRSTAREGSGLVSIEMTTDADRRKLLEDVKSRVDAIDTFPEDAEKPIVQEMIVQRQVVNVAVSGPADEEALRIVAEEVRDDLARYDSMSLVTLGNARPYEISIEVSEDALRRHGLTFDEVASAIRSTSLDLPGGSVKTEGGEYLIRAEGQAYSGREFEELTVVTRPDGSRLRVADVATVRDQFADTDQLTEFDGETTILVQAFRVGDQSALEISEDVAAYVEEKQKTLQGIRLTTWQDDSKILRSRLDLMLRNGRMGLIFVFACLALFLRLRLAFWVALGIPISFLGAIALLPAVGISINLLSLFAFIVVLGIVVDDAIVVGENIYTQVQEGRSGLDAAVTGAHEVHMPVIFAVLTTIAAFSPLLGVPGRYGEIMRVIPMIVILTLAFSLCESLLVLPCHLSHLKHRTESRGIARLWVRFQDLFANGLRRFIDGIYRPLLARAIENRYLTLASALVALAMTLSVVGAGWIKFVFFPPVDADNVVAYLTMPQGTPVDVTRAAVAHIERVATAVRDELAAEHGDVYRHVMTSIGGQPFREAQMQNRGQTTSFAGAHLAEVNIELLPSEDRSISSDEIAERWRARAGSVLDAEKIQYSSSIFASGEDINIELASEDFDELRAVAAKMKAELAKFAGVIDIADSHLEGKRELELDVTPSAEALGVRLSDLAKQARQGFYGEEVQRIQRRRDDVKVMLRYPIDERRSLGDVERMRVRTRDGDEIPFSTVAHVEFGRGFSTIERADRQRVVTVTAGVEKTANAQKINAILRETVIPRILVEHPSVTFGFEGEQRDQADALASLARGSVFAFFLIYALLAIPFRSYAQPLIVMVAIPFGVVGAIWGHLIMGLDLTFLSIFGVIALTGVVVNDSLVMVDFINRRHRAGEPLHVAAKESGAARFRPILLTSLTTFAGLMPLLFERSLQARFLIPMAVSLGWGVLFATAITLILVPVGYFIVEDTKSVVARLWRR